MKALGGGGRPTVRDVAERAGVSPQTVSNVINKRPVTRPETRRRVEAAIRELGYERDDLARALRLQRTHVLGFLMEDETRLTLQDPAHAALLSGLVERARHRHYTVTVLVCSPADVDRYVSSMLRQQRIAGLFLSLQGLEGAHSALLGHLADFGVPTVVLEQRTEAPVRAVTSDNEGGGRQLARHLLDLGHSKIGFVTGSVEWPGGERRFWGFSEVMAAAGIEVRVWRSPGWNPHAAEATATPVLAGVDRPTAIFAANDQLAIGVLRAAENLGLGVPGDLSVAGFDDFDLAALVRPALTTVRIDFVAMGEWAAETLVSLAEGGDPAPVVTLPTTLVVRSSTGPARGL